MKKFGFTLAEILITLGIIGVVAALTAPTLVNDSANAQIGPKLAKVVSTLEQANLAIINGQNTNRQILDSLNDLEIANNYVAYVQNLTEHISGSTILNSGFNRVSNYNDPAQSNTLRGTTLKLKQGIDVLINNFPLYNSSGNGLKGHYATAFVDIDGQDNGRNTYGIDVFIFGIDMNGTVIPAGSTTIGIIDNNNINWNADGNYKCNRDEVTIGWGCAGSIFENNLKVIYR